MTIQVKTKTDAPRLADFTQDRRIVLLALLASVIGVLSALLAVILVKMIALTTNLFFFHQFSFVDHSPVENVLGIFVILIPMVGGLLIGLMARFGSEKIRGHGIPEALEAILIGRSRMDAKVAVLKPISSAISIGSGGPFGSEGPIIMTGGAAGSLFAQLFQLSASERKTLLVAGAAGGMAAIFATPVAAILLAVELLLFEWRPRSFIPVAVAASVASIVRIPLLGNGPIFAVPPHAALSTGHIGVAVLIGLVAGFGSIILTFLVYGFEDLFHKLPIHWMWWPILGGLVVGIGGWMDPRVFGVGYTNIHGLLLGQDLGGNLLMLLVIKALIWAVALGSGTSGGVLAPLLIIGGTLGSLESRFLPYHDPGLWALIGMASLMGGTMRSPLTAIIFALELTHNISALPALLVSCVAAHAVTVLLIRRSILTEKVNRRGHHLMREYGVDPLLIMRVKDIMDRQVTGISANMLVAELAKKIASGVHEYVRHHAIPILDSEGKLAGLITRGDITSALRGGTKDSITVWEAGSANVITVLENEILESVVKKMLRNHIGRVLVVSSDDPGHLIGYVGRSAIIAARQQVYEEEYIREPGWLFPKKPTAI